MLFVLAILAPAANPIGVLADAPDVVSGNGITVSGTRWISTRTLEVDISTQKVAANAVNGPHRVRITLPDDYFERPETRYPVLYLLHGGSGGNSAQWTTGGGDTEAITAGEPLITVMPDGGKVGWYTNWVEQTQGAQNWADFHLNQLIPWIDANLRTIASKSGRAIAGLSMGGFGAVRYAQDRPDLFAYVASFSGAVDLGDYSNYINPSGVRQSQAYGTRFVIGEQAMQNGYLFTGPFGNPFPPFDTGWTSVNPVNRPERLLQGGGVGVALYVGSGIGPWDVLEGTMAISNETFHDALDAAGVPHVYDAYGRPGSGCDGGHNFGCWNYAFRKALPRMLDALETPEDDDTDPPPPAGNLIADGDFEAPGLGPWACTGNCGADHGAGLAHSGTGNGFVRNTSGWNDIHQAINVAPGRTYEVTAWIRTSSNNSAGRLGLRTAGGEVVGERQFGRLDGYTKLTTTVNSGSNSSLVFYAGLTASGDTWLQIDDVSVTAPAIPETAIDSGPAGTTAQTDATFAFSADLQGASFECRLDSAEFASCASPQGYEGLADGEHTFAVRARNGTGDVDPTPAARTWTVDTAAPETTIDSGPSASTADADAAFSFSSTEAGAFECALDSAEFAPCEPPQSYAGLTDGEHTFAVRAADEAGNVDLTAATRTWTIDTTAPVIEITGGPAEGSTTRDRSATFTFTVDGHDAGPSCRIDSGPAVSCDSPFSTGKLGRGTHVFTVSATDTVGNQRSVSRSWTITTGPRL